MENLLGAYGSDEDEVEEQQQEETQQTGQVTLLRDDDSGGGLDLSHLTSGPATRLAEADTAAAAAAGTKLPTLRPQSAAAPEHQRDGAGAGAAGEGMDVDGQPQLAGGGSEQPPAADDPFSLLPPEMREAPEGECNPQIQARVANWLHLQHSRGKYINEEIRKSRGYRNPEFFAKMVEHLEIDQYGTAFAPEVFDPKSLPPEDYLAALQKEWAAEEERRKTARAAGQGRVEFTKSASQPNLMPPAMKPGISQPAPPPLPPTLQPPTLQPPQLPPTLQPPIGIAAAQAAAQAAAAAAAQAAAMQAHRVGMGLPPGMTMAHVQAQAQARASALAAAQAQAQAQANALAAAQAQAAKLSAQGAANLRR